MAYDKEPELWLKEIEHGLEYRKRYGKEESWNTLEMLMNHDFGEMVVGDNPGPNIIMSNADSLLSSLNVNDPYATIRPRKSQFVEKAPVVESEANYLLKRMELGDEVDAAILAAYLYGRGFIKVGYDSEFGFDQRFDVGIDSPWGMTATQLNLRTQSMIEDKRIDPGMPWTKFVLPHDIVVPWGVRDLESTPFIAHRILRHIDDLKADPKYENKKDLKPTVTRNEFHQSYERVMQLYRVGEGHPILDSWRTGPNRGKDDQRCYVEMWEIHDRRTRTVKVVAQNHKKFLRDQMDNTQVDGKVPFVSICFQPRTRNFWTTPDAYYLKYHQRELTDIAIQKTKKRRLDIPKAMVREDAFDSVAMNRLTNPDVGGIIPVKVDGPISEAIAMFNAASPNQNLMMEEEAIRRNSREMIGFSRNQIGEYEQTGRRTATEANLVQQASDMRLDRRQKQVKKLYVNSIWYALKLAARYWKIPKQVEVLGEDGAQVYFSITGEDLDGDYDYDVGFSVGGNESLQQRRSSALGFYQIAVQDPLADPVEVRRFVVHAMNDPRFTKIFSRSLANGQPQQVPPGPQGQGSLAGIPMGGGGAGQAPAAA